MNEIYLSLGSNLGDRNLHIESAYNLIENLIGKITARSNPYENKAEGFESDDLFLNTCIKLQSNLKPLELLSQIQKIEKEIGRTKKTVNKKYVSRLIDIDIIYYNDQIICTETLTVPHKHFRSRKFVLIPLLEIDKIKVDPISQLTTKQLLSFT